jgi:hypothetical protein
MIILLMNLNHKIQNFLMKIMTNQIILMYIINILI